LEPFDVGHVPDHEAIHVARTPMTVVVTPTGATSRPRALLQAAAAGAAAGVAGAAVMAAGEKAEQAVTKRPDSFVPGRTLLSLAGRSVSETQRPVGANHAMHYMTGAALGALRGLWAATGIRGVRADLGHTIARLMTDQTLENLSGAGAPPRTWPRREQVVDYLHKAVYSLVTGTLTDRLVAANLSSERGRVSH